MFNNRLWAYKCYVVLLMVCILRQKCILGAEDFSTEEDDLESDEIVFQDEEDEVTTIAPEVKTQVSKADFFLENDNFAEEPKPVSTTKEQRSRANDSPVYPDPLGNYDTRAEIQNLDNKIKKSMESLRRFDDAQDETKDVDNSPVSSFGDDDDEQGQRFKDWIAHQKNMAYTAYERHRSHHESYKPYKEHKVPKAYSKYKKYDHQRTRPNYDAHQPPYYQGQLNYYGSNSDTSSGYSSHHSPTKMRNHRLHHNHDSHPHHHHHHHHSHHRYVHGMNDYNRDRKWPHLTRVQYQLYEEKDHDEDLPPYIRKYNRRNKQLLDLLEGTMPPPTPPQKSSENMVANKRRQRKHHRYHSRRNPKRIIEDLFEEQRANPNNPNKNEDDQYMNDSASSVVYSSLPTMIAPKSNAPLAPPSIPDSSSSSFSSSSSLSQSRVSSKTSSSDGSYDASSPLGMLSASPGLAASNKDSDSDELKLIQKNELPGDHIDISDEEDTSTADSSHFGGVRSNSQQLAQSPNSAHFVSSVVTPHDELKVSPKANKFIYHRVPSPRVVGVGGVGGINGSKKQRLPFVAITDRRLEPSKTRQKDIEQNHLPLP